MTVTAAFDCNNIMRKCFYAMKPLSHKGKQTHAIKGLLNKVHEVTSRFNVDQFALCFDSKGKNFRHELYPDYKGTRAAGKKAQESKTPHLSEEDFARQCQVAVKLFRALGYPVLRTNGIEADDYLGSVAYQSAQSTECSLVVIVSSDKDFNSLVSKKVRILDNNISRDVLQGPRDVLARYGIKPSQFIDYLAMVGDSVDNIPGVDQIGPKTAMELLLQFGSIDEMKRRKSEIKPSVLKHLQRNAKNLTLSKKLVTIKLDLELPDSLKRRNPSEEAKDLLAELGFTSEMNRSLAFKSKKSLFKK